MWALSKDVISILLFIYVLTQLIIPCFSSVPFFNLHKRSGKNPKSKLEDLDAKADEFREIKSEVKEHEAAIKKVKSKLNN